MLDDFFLHSFARLRASYNDLSLPPPLTDDGLDDSLFERLDFPVIITGGFMFIYGSEFFNFC